MVTKTVFRKIEKIKVMLYQDLAFVEKQNIEPIKKAEKNIMIIDQSIRLLKSMVAGDPFECAADEIFFFKEVKPLFISKFIYYSAILNVESLKPDTGNKCQKNYYENELEKLTHFYKENANFCSYYNRNATYLDQKYFIRNSFDLKMKLSTKLYNFDESFTTSHDHLVAEILAGKLLKEYYHNMILTLSKNAAEINESFTPLVWSSSKVSFVELIYGLYQMRCFNGGNIDLSEVMRFFEKSFSIEVGNYHKTIFEIRNRKNGSTKFLQLLQENLSQHFVDTEVE